MPKIFLAMAKSSDPLLLLLDTHIWLWDVAGARQLRPSTRASINEAAKAGLLRLSVFSLWEISTLASRRKIELGKPTTSWIDEARQKSLIVFEPLSVEIAVEANELPAGFRSDPADLIIVATARVTGATLMTRDSRILDYAAVGHLNAIAA